MPAPKKKPVAPDDRLEAFHLWAQTDERRAPEGTPVVMALAGALAILAAAVWVLWG